MPKIISDQAVFDATLKLLVQAGYAGATTKLIAEAAGINEASLFRKYGSKPALISAAIAHSAYALAKDEIVYTGEIETDLRRAAEGYVGTMERHGHLFPVVLSEMARHPELRQSVSGPHAVIRDTASLMARYQQEGVLVTDEEPLQAVASFLGPLIVIRMLTSAAPALAPAPLDLKAHVRRFLRGRA